MSDIKKIKKRFLMINRERLKRTRNSLMHRQQEVLDMLPLLFHANHAAFPGFVASDAPVGISDFSPNKNTLAAGKRLVRSFEYKRRALQKYDIYSIFLMGSTGTIAYSKTSDFDIWVCHSPDLSQKQINQLQQKATAIENWAAEYDLEIHFFLMEPESFRKGDYVELSVESSGSAQHHLLLEEFYRTSVLIAGRFPIWWLVPSTKESDYDEYVTELINKRRVTVNETIDFGALPDVPAEEFFGAALWQLFKGIDSPYKAVLKLMLMEVYASEYPKVDLLCLRFKQAIHEGATDLASIDPYMMLYKKIDEYLREKNDERRLAQVRRCFYFKVNEQLGGKDTERNLNWRRQAMREIVNSWGWKKAYLTFLDQRLSWKIHRVIDERQSLVSMLTQSYQFLSAFARQHAHLSKINQRDLNILGRKLYAAFERKAGKIEIMNRGISDDLWESHLSIHLVGQQDMAKVWVLYQGIINVEQAAVVKPLKRSKSIVEIMAWAFFNRILNEKTSVGIYAGEEMLDARELNGITRCLQQLFPEGKVDKINMDALTQSSKLSKAALFINVGMNADPGLDKDGYHLTSYKTDALCFSGICENLVLSIDQVFETTWQEIMTFHFERVEGFLECLSSVLQWSPPSKGIAPPPVKAFCFTSGRATAISNRIEALFSDVIDCFYHNESYTQAKYVLTIEYSFYFLDMHNDTLRYQKFASSDDLIEYLGNENASFSQVIFDRYSLQDSVIPLIFSYNKQGVIQLFYQQIKNTFNIYIIDENGSLFTQKIVDASVKPMLDHYGRFFNEMSYRQNIQFNATMDSGEDLNKTIEYFHIVKRAGNPFKIKSVSAPQVSAVRTYINLQVIVDVEGGVTVYCDDQEYSWLEYGDQVFLEVAKHVLERRRSGLLYPIYITDLDLPLAAAHVDQSDKTQTVYFLKYKREIEQKLNTALAQVGAKKEAFTIA